MPSRNVGVNGVAGDDATAGNRGWLAMAPERCVYGVWRMRCTLCVAECEADYTVVANAGGTMSRQLSRVVSNVGDVVCTLPRGPFLYTVTRRLILGWHDRSAQTQ